LKHVMASVRAFARSNMAFRGAALALMLYSTGTVSAQLPESAVPQAATAGTTLQNARKLVDAGEFKQASGVLLLFLQDEPRSAKAHTLLGYCMLRLNDPKGSLAEYTRAAAIERPNAADLQNIAKDYVLLDDLSDADHWMSLAVKLNDQDPEAWYGLGRVRYSLQRFQEASACFKRALVLSPRSAKAENNLGLAYEGLNRTDDAIAAYRQAIAWQQDAAHPSEQPLLNLAIILVHQGKLQEAQVLLTRAVAIAPGDPRIREQLGHLYLQLNLLEEAQQQFEEAIALTPENPSLHFMLGRVFHQEGQEEKAKSEFARSATLSGYHSTPATN
jgi:Flp pilus assembly protein TadD